MLDSTNFNEFLSLLLLFKILGSFTLRWIHIIMMIVHKCVRRIGRGEEPTSRKKNHGRTR